MQVFKKTLIVGAMTIFSLNALAERNTVYTAPAYVQHYYEFDANRYENPDHNWWCGQTALKIVARFHTNTTYNLQTIHNTLVANNRLQGTTGLYAQNNCAGHWCAYIEDLVYAARNNLNMPNAAITEINNSGSTNPQLADKVSLFNSIRTGVRNRRLMMAYGSLSTNPTNLSATGHAWVIMGYDTGTVANPPDPSGVWVFLRDDNLTAPAYPEMDRWVTIDTLYRMMAFTTTNRVKVATF